MQPLHTNKKKTCIDYYITSVCSFIKENKSWFTQLIANTDGVRKMRN